jgi:pyruvate dehydrogenase E1 component alpha subunit
MTTQIDRQMNGISPGSKLNGEVAISEAAAQQRQQDKERNLELYRTMLLIRRLEEKTAEAYTQGKIGGFLHLYIGQEAVATGVLSCLQPDDHVLTHYRDHGYAAAKGCDPGRMLAEMYGKATGLSGGKGGSMHLADVSRHFWGGYAIVGGHLPMATGIAQSIKYQGQSEVVVCVMGDGATNIGMFHEALNMAALYQLPIVYLVENNLYSMGTPLKVHTALTEIHQKARAYGMPGDRFDGMDIETVIEHVTTAVQRARQGEGPSLLEAMTYRYRGHSMADPQFYRSKSDIEEVRSHHDPILLHAQRMYERGIFSEEDTKQVEQAVEQIVAQAVKFAEESPFPSPEDLFTNIYAEA